MKWILIAILIIVVMLIAKSFTEQYIEKYNFYFNLKNFFNQFKINLSFKKNKILEFLDSINAKREFAKFKHSYIQFLSTGELNLNEIKVIDFDEKSRLKDMVLSMGKFDAKNEIIQLETYIIEIDDKLKKAEIDKTKLCPLILKLSLLFAIGFAIILL